MTQTKLEVGERELCGVNMCLMGQPIYCNALKGHTGTHSFTWTMAQPLTGSAGEASAEVTVIKNSDHDSNNLDCDCKGCLKNVIEQLAHQLDIERGYKRLAEQPVASGSAGLRERLEKLQVFKFGASASSWDDIVPTEYYRVDEVLAALASETVNPELDIDGEAETAPAAPRELQVEVVEQATELLRKAKQSDLGWKVLSSRDIVKLLATLDTELQLRKLRLAALAPAPAAHTRAVRLEDGGAMGSHYVPPAVAEGKCQQRRRKSELG